MNIGTVQNLSKYLSSAVKRSAAVHEVKPSLNPGELCVLEYLLENPAPRSIREIVRGTGLAQSWVSKIVQGLVVREWANTSTNPKDRRTTVVHLNEYIVEASRNILLMDATPGLRELLPGMTNAELKAIKCGLETLATVISRQQSVSDESAGTGARRENPIQNRELDRFANQS